MIQLPVTRPIIMKSYIYADFHLFIDSFMNCPECGEQMEEVVGFDGYVWCRECHITKNVEEDVEEEERPSEERNVVKAN